MEVSPLLSLSAFGIYTHAIFVSITLGLPVAILTTLYRYSKTNESFLMDAARKMTVVLVINFAVGAITGTLVEFGLVQAWPGTIFAIATFVFSPLALELIAFANEVVLLVLFFVTLGRIKPMASFSLLFAYWIFALLSGVFITTVNSWLVAPWGTGSVAEALYPFMPEFGPSVLDVQKLILLKILLVASKEPLQNLIQNPEFSSKVGIVLRDPTVVLSYPYAIWSDFHNVTAGVIVGMSLTLAAWTYGYSKNSDERYLTIAKSFLPVLLILLIIQPIVFGHFMGEQVVQSNPTKFAMMEGARTTFQNPLLGLIAYGEPSHPIIGFNDFYAKCDEHGDKTLRDLASDAGLGEKAILATAEELNVAISKEELKETLNTKLQDLCKMDLSRAEKRLPLVHFLYYTKLASGVIALLSVIALALAVYEFPKLSLTRKLLEGRLFLLAVLIAGGSIGSAVLGWAVREIGRKPWTVYGLLWSEEVVTAVRLATTPLAIFLGLVILLIAAFGLTAIYLTTRR